MYTYTQGDLSSEAVKAGLYYAQNGGRASTDTLIRDRLTNAQGRIAAAFTVNADSQIKSNRCCIKRNTGAYHALCAAYR